MESQTELFDYSDDDGAPGADVASSVDRRGFLKVALATAAVAGLNLTRIAEANATDIRVQGPQQAPLPALGNGEPPAMQFQAYPGGTGAYMEKIARDRGRAAFDRATMTVEPWSGAVPSSEEEIAFLPMHRLAALIQARRVTSVQLTDIYLSRLKRLDPTLLCAVTILDGPAREAAQQADREIAAGNYRGPLHGIPWGIKDLFAVKGARTTWGSNAFENRVIDEDAEVFVRLRDAGAVLIAKLATGLFAQGDQWYRGQTKNPWNLQQGSSGSSAGPASATAAGCVAFGIGTETQGSIVSPTTRCGLSALRPTFGRVSRYGGMVLAWSMDKVGPICRTIEDCALVFNTIYGADEKDPATVTAPFQWERKIDLSRLRIGYDDRAPEAFVAKLRELGASPRAIGARPNMAGLNALNVESAAAFDFYVSTLDTAMVDSVLAAAAARAAARRGGGGGGAGRAGAGAAGRGRTGGAAGAGRGAGGPPPGANSPLAAAQRFASGRKTSALDFMQAQRRRHLLMLQMADFMKDLDMYVSGQGDVALTNQTGHPAAVVPYAMSEGDNPQPLCTTLIGNLFEDDRILSVAHAFQAATDWHLRHPKLG